MTGQGSLFTLSHSPRRSELYLLRRDRRAHPMHIRPTVRPATEERRTVSHGDQRVRAVEARRSSSSQTALVLARIEVPKMRRPPTRRQHIPRGLEVACRRYLALMASHLHLAPSLDAAPATPLPDGRISVVLGADHAFVSRAVRLLLDNEDGVDVIDEAGDLATIAPSSSRNARRALLALILKMPNGSGLCGDQRPARADGEDRDRRDETDDSLVFALARVRIRSGRVRLEGAGRRGATGGCPCGGARRAVREPTHRRGPRSPVPLTDKSMR